MLDRTTVPPPSSDAELDAIMARMRAELAAQREASAAGALAMDALPTRMAAFAALSDDAFVEAAFRVTLGRSPTPEEREQTGWQIRGRMSRAVKLERMLALPEARARGARIGGVRRQAFLDRVSRVLRESGATAWLRPLRRIARGLRRLLRAAPRLARFDEALAATRQAAVAEQTERFTSFALQQAELQRGLAARLAALDGGDPSPTLARALAEAAMTLPDAAALARLRGVAGAVGAPGATPELRAALAGAGVRLAAEGEVAGALLVPSGASLTMLDALLAEAPARLAPGGFCLLPAAVAAVAMPCPGTPAAAAPAALLRRLVELHGLAWETAEDGTRLARLPA